MRHVALPYRLGLSAKPLTCRPSLSASPLRLGPPRRAYITSDSRPRPGSDSEKNDAVNASQNAKSQGRQTTVQKPTKATPNPPPKPKRRRAIWISAALLGAVAFWAASDSRDSAVPDDGSSNHRSGASLNQETFVPFEVVARETVSPTAFVLTLRLPRGASAESRDKTSAAISRAWQHGLWSVEVKQPQLQIARDYTPLPSLPSLPGAATDNGSVDIRIFVRTVPGGEVSRYLSQRVVGSTVDVRGPRLSFDVASRANVREPDAHGKDAKDDKKVVILAGGTGIATALQAAAAVLGASPGQTPAVSTAVTILWANRLPQDSIGLDQGDAALANPIVRDLRALQARYGARVRIINYVDAQQTFIKEGDVQRVMGGEAEAGGGYGVWPFWPFWPFCCNKSPTIAPPATTSGLVEPTCVYHSPEVLEKLEADPEHGSARARCLCRRANPDASLPGKNLVLVSGPDGFISAWAGPKLWAAGQERQGRVGGILGAMAARDPRFAEWQVLKL